MYNKKEGRIKRVLRFIYLKLVRINDSPQRISLGLGLGVFLGLLPGTGPLASLGLAFLFRLNRIAALLGSILTNTWLSLAIFPLSIKVGSAIMGLEWQVAKQGVLALFNDFHWQELCKISALQVLLPVLIGYCVIGLGLALIAYLLALLVLKRRLFKKGAH